MTDINVVLFYYLLKQHKSEIDKLTSEIDKLTSELDRCKHQLASVRATRALMRFMREQDINLV